jgi:hypothetical protein
VLVTGEFVEALLAEGSLELAKAFVDEGFHVLRGCKEPIRLFSVGNVLKANYVRLIGHSRV